MSFLKTGSIKTHHALWISFLILATALAGVPFNSEFLPNYAQATSVTVTNQKGQNLYIRSEQFDNAAWQNFNTTINANTASTTDPLGGNGAEEIRETAVTSVFVVGATAAQTSLGNMASQTLTASVYVKDNTRRFFTLRINTTLGHAATFDLTLGTVTYTDTGVTGKIVPVGNGWYRVSTTVTLLTTETATASVYHALNQTGGNYASYAGNPGKSLYIWGAQLTVGTNPGIYNRTVATAFKASFVPTGATKSNQLGQNLNTYSEQLDNVAGWAAHDVTISANTTTAPNGTRTAEKMTESSLNIQHYLAGLATQTDQTKAYSLSVYAKAAEETSVVITPSGSGSYTGTFNLVNGTAALVGVTGGIYPVGNGWYRCWINVPANLGFNMTEYFLVRQYNAFLGDGVSGVYLWGAQYVKGNQPAIYNPVTAAAFKTTYNPAGATKSNQKGQNLIKFSEQLDNAVYALTNISSTPDTIVPPQSARLVYRLTDNITNSTHSIAAQQLPTVSTSTVTLSVYAKAGTGTWFGLFGNGGQNGRYFNLATGVMGVGGGNATQTMIPIGGGWYRCTITFTAKKQILNFNVFMASADNTVTYAGTGLYNYFTGLQVVYGTKPGLYNKTTSATFNSTYQP